MRMRLSGDLCGDAGELIEADRGIDVTAQHGFAGLDVAGEHYIVLLTFLAAYARTYPGLVDRARWIHATPVVRPPPKPEPLRRVENITVNELWQLHKQSRTARVRFWRGEGSGGSNDRQEDHSEAARAYS